MLVQCFLDISMVVWCLDLQSYHLWWAMKYSDHHHQLKPESMVKFLSFQTHILRRTQSSMVQPWKKIWEKWKFTENQTLLAALSLTNSELIPLATIWSWVLIWRSHVTNCSDCSLQPSKCTWNFFVVHSES